MRVLPGDDHDPFIPPSAPNDAEAEFPVWWPGRFEAAENGDVHVLARYAGPGSELWVARITSYNVCYTKLLRAGWPIRAPPGAMGKALARESVLPNTCG